jgi:hypothetical protein
MQDTIQLQRAVVAEHFRAENAHDWAAVHETFVQSDRAYYDVVPLSTRYKGPFSVSCCRGIAQRVPSRKAFRA